MTKIGVLSDTHGHLPKEVYEFFKDVDLIIHAGDIGSVDVLNELQAFKKTVAVYGNIDDFEKYSYSSLNAFSRHLTCDISSACSIASTAALVSTSLSARRMS